MKNSWAVVIAITIIVAIGSCFEVKYGSPNTGKWVPVGSGITVSLFSISGTPPAEAVSSRGTWYTCNYGQSVPEALGTLYSFDQANALSVSLPTKEQFELINNSSYCSYTWLTVHGQKGVVIKADRGFLFQPAQYSSLGLYWPSTEFDIDSAWYFDFTSSGGHGMSSVNRAREFAVRPFQN